MSTTQHLLKDAIRALASEQVSLDFLFGSLVGSSRRKQIVVVAATGDDLYGPQGGQK